MKRRSDYVEVSKTLLEELYYKQGLKQREIAEKLGVSAKTIGNGMQEYGLITRSHDDYVYIDMPKSELERLYIQENRTAPEIAKIYDCATSVVYRRLLDHGIDVKPGGWDKVKRIVPDERLQWSSEFAYVIGLLASDGNLKRQSNEVKIASTDRELTDWYCRCLGLRPHDVSASVWGDLDAVEIYCRHEIRPPYLPQYHIIFSDYEYRARLEAIGLTPNKSNTIGPLKIPDEYFADFLRGEFDGDGCWSANTRRQNYILGIFTSGSRVYLEWLKQSIERLAKIRPGYISGINLRYEKERVVELGEFMYYHSTLPSLTRKRTKWEMLVATMK